MPNPHHPEGLLADGIRQGQTILLHYGEGKWFEMRVEEGPAIRPVFVGGVSELWLTIIIRHLNSECPQIYTLAEIGAAPYPDGTWQAHRYVTAQA